MTRSFHECILLKILHILVSADLTHTMVGDVAKQLVNTNSEDDIESSSNI